MRHLKIIGFLFLSLLLLAGCALLEPAQQPDAGPPSGQQPLTGFEDVANYIEEYGKLPDNFITKEEARKKGWEPQKGNLHEAARGKSIGGDIFHNREGRLPNEKGRIWYEADINYVSGHRGKDRIVFSNDGLIYKTEDHYSTYEQLK